MRALSALARPEYNATRALELCDWPAGAVGSSQNQEDIALFVTFFCGHTKPGTVVEIGALDGHLFSNSLFFEEYLGWKGVLIEGAPGNAKSSCVRATGRRLSVSLSRSALRDNGTWKC